MKPALITLDAARNGTYLYAGASLSPIYHPIKRPYLRPNAGAIIQHDSSPVGRSLIVRRASDITPEPIEWLWPSRIVLI